METTLEQILERLSTSSTNDPEQEMNELSTILFEKASTNAEISFCCAKLLNSNIGLLTYLKRNTEVKDKQTPFLKRRICELLKNLIKKKPQYVREYLDGIYVVYGGDVRTPATARLWWMETRWFARQPWGRWLRWWTAAGRTSWAGL